MVKGQYDQAAGSLGLVFRIGMPVVFNRFGSGYMDFKRASTGNGPDSYREVFKRIKKKLTDIGFCFSLGLDQNLMDSVFLQTLD